MPELNNANSLGINWDWEMTIFSRQEKILNKIYNYSLHRFEFKFNFQRVNRKEGERAMRKSAPCNHSKTDIDFQICKRDIQRV